MNFIDRQAVTEVIVLSFSLVQRSKDKRDAPSYYIFNKLTSVFYASVMLSIMNFAITLSK